MCHGLRSAAGAMTARIGAAAALAAVLGAAHDYCECCVLCFITFLASITIAAVSYYLRRRYCATDVTSDAAATASANANAMLIAQSIQIRLQHLCTSIQQHSSSIQTLPAKKQTF